MSVSFGRMSRQEASTALLQLKPAIYEFTAPDASPATLEEATDCERVRADLLHRQDSAPGSAPNAQAIRALRTRVAALQASRLANSLQTPPRIRAAVCITLYGLQANDTARAAFLAAEALYLDAPEDVRLQDSSHVRSATLTGTRYIFTTHTP